MVYSVILASVLAAASPAPAADAADAKPVCKFITELQSRIPKRVCQTAAEWEEQARESQEAMEKQGSVGRREVPPN